MRLEAAWLRSTSIVPGVQVSVSLDLEGPQEDNLADDIAATLGANPAAQAFFDGMPTFYRKKYLRWIDSTKRSPDIRAQRINNYPTRQRATRALTRHRYQMKWSNQYASTFLFAKSDDGAQG